MEEIWKSIIEDLYEVSNKGVVRSIGRLVSSTFGGTYFKEGRILKQNNNTRGCPQVMLCQNGLNVTQRVHRLVAENFIANPLNLPEVNHKDLDTMNNCVENLEWVTAEENNLHALLLGSRKRGERASNSKLTEVDVVVIKRELLVSKTNKEIANIFGVHPGTIQCIRTGRNWSHVN